MSFVRFTRLQPCAAACTAALATLSAVLPLPALAATQPLTFAATQPLTPAATRPLTFDAAQRIALERSHLLRAQDASVSASREMAIAAGQLPDPVIKLGIDNMPVDGPDRFSLSRDSMTMRRIGVMQEMTRDDKRRLKTERFEREADRTLAEKAANAAQIERDTALAWLDRYYAEAVSREIAEQIRLSQMEVEAAEGLYRGGRGNAADQIGYRATSAMLEDRAREAAGRIRVARHALARWVGHDGHEGDDGADAALAGSPPDTASLGFDPAALDAHLSGHPELQALTRQEAVADVDVRLAQANRRSDWTWEVAFQQRGSSYSNMVSVEVSIPWQWDRTNRQDREVAARLAQVDEARARRDETFRAHRAELKTMITEWETARQRAQRYRDEILRLARERSDALTAAWRTSRSSSLVDVIAAQRSESDVRIQILNLEAQVARLWAQIRFIVPHASRGVATGGKR
jgi:outer membrane protein TolC